MSYTHLTSDDRTTLAALLRAGHTQVFCAKQLGKDPSTISRELQRNPHPKTGRYHAREAQRMTTQRRRAANQQRRIIVHDSKLQQYIIRRLKRADSPEQIAGKLQQQYGYTVVCHETIYQWIYKQRKDLKGYLRCTKRQYRRRYRTRIREKQREMNKKKRIDQRPDIVEQRGRIGDWEGDAIVGKERTQRILTLVDRASGYLRAFKLDETSAKAVREFIQDFAGRLPKKKLHTLTLDNGSEFSEHEELEERTSLDVYFAYPYHSWERGTNENTNGLLRYFFPKGSTFADVTQEDVDRAVRSLNTRPRKRLNYATPSEIFYERVAL
jgi:transposase, IS30 family